MYSRAHSRLSGSFVDEPFVRSIRRSCPVQPYGIAILLARRRGGLLGDVHADHPFDGLDFGVFEGVVGADLYALGVAAAEITVVGDVLVFVEPHHAEGTGDHAHLAADALVVIDLHHAVGVAGDRVGGAVAEAGSVFTVEAGDRQVDGLVYEVVDKDAGLGGLEGAFVEEGAGALAEMAGNAFLRVGEDHLHGRAPFQRLPDYAPITIRLRPAGVNVMTSHRA